MRTKQVLKKQMSVDEKVQILIEKIHSLKEEYDYKVYLLLEEILKLRQSQLSNYHIYTLSKEKNLDLPEGTIRYLFGFRYMSDKTKTLIDTGVLKASTFLHLIRKSSDLRNPTLQNRIIKKVLKGEITGGQISYMPMNEIIKVKGNQKVDKSIQLTSKVIYKVNNLKREIKTNKKLFTNDHLNKSLKRQVKKLYKVVNKL